MLERRSPSSSSMRATQAGASHGPRARSLPQRLLRLAVAPRERPVGVEPSVPRRRPAHPFRASQAPWLASGACGPARGGPNGQSRASGAPDAPAWYLGPGRTSVPTLHHDSRHDLPIAPNLLKQLFSAARPNTVWLAEPKDRVATSPTCRPEKAGSTWPPCSISPPARSSAGPCATTCGPN